MQRQTRVERVRIVLDLEDDLLAGRLPACRTLILTCLVSRRVRRKTGDGAAPAHPAAEPTTPTPVVPAAQAAPPAAAAPADAAPADAADTEPGAGAPVDPGTLAGHYAFGWSGGKTAKCRKVDAKMIKKLSGKDATCRQSETSEAFAEGAGVWSTCEVGESKWAVFATKAICQEQLETMEANAP